MRLCRAALRQASVVARHCAGWAALGLALGVVQVSSLPTGIHVVCTLSPIGPFVCQCMCRSAFAIYRCACVTVGVAVRS